MDYCSVLIVERLDCLVLSEGHGKERVVGWCWCDDGLDAVEWSIVRQHNVSVLYKCLITILIRESSISRSSSNIASA